MAMITVVAIIMMVTVIAIIVVVAVIAIVMVVAPISIVISMPVVAIPVILAFAYNLLIVAAAELCIMISVIATACPWVTLVYNYFITMIPIVIGVIVVANWRGVPIHCFRCIRIGVQAHRNKYQYRACNNIVRGRNLLGPIRVGCQYLRLH